MIDEPEINIFKALDFIRDNAALYAKAKANRIYLEEFKKSKKAICMTEAAESGASSIGMQERDAYTAKEYIQLLEGLKAAVEEEERLRWMIIAAQTKIEVWRTLESSRRIEAKSL